jgi:hypothetical protein
MTTQKTIPKLSRHDLDIDAALRPGGRRYLPLLGWGAEMRNRDGFIEPIFKANRAGSPSAFLGYRSTCEVGAAWDENLKRCLPTESGR